VSQIAFTYDVGTAVGQVRLYAGDTDAAGLNRTGGDRTRTDGEIEFLLAQNGNNVRAAAAELLEGRAAEYAQQAMVTEQGTLRQDLRVRSRRCLDVANALWMRSQVVVLRNAGSVGFEADAMEDW
jgi:hypothetical protein